MKRPKIEGRYTEHYVSTISPKLKELVDIKKTILEEPLKRFLENNQNSVYANQYVNEKR